MSDLPTHPDSLQPEWQNAVRLWGLDTTLDLTRTAADFYLLYDLNLVDKDDGWFALLLSKLTSMFAQYTDMIIGGELRHLVRTRQPILREEFVMSGMSRPIAWIKWRDFRKKYGVAALTMASRAFGKGTKQSFGGAKWAHIARVLQMHETGVLTPLMFVDFCWGLQHNGGTYFNKVWVDNDLRRVLDANLREDWEKMYRAASHTVSTLHAEGVR